MSEKILKVEKVYKSFIQPDKDKLVVLEDLSLQVETGSMIAFTGGSGSGKIWLVVLIHRIRDKFTILAKILQISAPGNVKNTGTKK